MYSLLRPVAASLLAGALFIGCANQKSAQEVRTESEGNNAAVDLATPGRQLVDASQPLGRLTITSGRAYPGLPPGWNTEDYAVISENEFLQVTDEPLSTFSIDVDAASYSNVRRFIRDGMLPPKDAVRIEEMINYFSYDYPEPESGQPFSTVLEVGPAPWNAGHQLLHVGLRGQTVDFEDRPSSNLVFLLDVSGSMNSPRKLPLLKNAFRMLVGELGKDDRVSIVVYAGAAGLVLPPTPGDRNEEILASLEALHAGGSTAGAAGIELAYQTAAEHFIPAGINRVILATDGDFNVGTSSDAELVRLIEDRREGGTFLTVLGFGTGNLKDNKMEQLANHGNGSYYYIDSGLEARKVLVTELGGTLQTIAKDVKLQLEFNPAHIAAYRLVGYENRLLANQDFNDDTKDAGELGAGHTVTALYELIPVGAENAEVRAVDELRYQSSTPTVASASDELLTLKLRYKEPDGETSRLLTSVLNRPEEGTAVTADFAFSASVAAFGMILRDSEFRGATDVSQVLALARLGRGADLNGYRADFIRMVEDYAALSARFERASRD